MENQITTETPKSMGRFRNPLRRAGMAFAVTLALGAALAPTTVDAKEAPLEQKVLTEQVEVLELVEEGSLAIRGPAGRGCKLSEHSQRRYGGSDVCRSPP